MQFQFHYTPLNTSVVATSATAIIVSASSQRRGPTKVEQAMTLVIDSISGGGSGSAGVAIFTASGVVVQRFPFGANDSGQFNPIHIELGQGEALEMSASGSTAAAFNIGFHRK